MNRKSSIIALVKESEQSIKCGHVKRFDLKSMKKTIKVENWLWNCKTAAKTHNIESHSNNGNGLTWTLGILDLELEQWTFEILDLGLTRTSGMLPTIINGVY